MDGADEQADQIAALLGAWRAQICSEPFAYSDAQLLAEHRRRSETPPAAER